MDCGLNLNEWVGGHRYQPISREYREHEWEDALDALKDEDHYILVLVGQAFGFSSVPANRYRVRDFLIYIVAGIGIVLYVILKAFWRLGH